jgi:hypothetical protein
MAQLAAGLLLVVGATWAFIIVVGAPLFAAIVQP